MRSRIRIGAFCAAPVWRSACHPCRCCSSGVTCWRTSSSPIQTPLQPLSNQASVPAIAMRQRIEPGDAEQGGCSSRLRAGPSVPRQRVVPRHWSCSGAASPSVSAQASQTAVHSVRGTVAWFGWGCSQEARMPNCAQQPHAIAIGIPDPLQLRECQQFLCAPQRPLQTSIRLRATGLVCTMAKRKGQRCALTAFSIGQC